MCPVPLPSHVAEGWTPLLSHGIPWPVAAKKASTCGIRSTGSIPNALGVRTSYRNAARLAFGPIRSELSTCQDGRLCRFERYDELSVRDPDVLQGPAPEVHR